MSKKIAVILVIILFFGLLFQALLIMDYYSEQINLGIFNKNVVTGTYFKSLDESVSERFFMPFDTLVRNNGVTWSIRREDNIIYDALWTGAGEMLEKALSSQYIEKIEVSLWTELCLEQGATYSFGNYFPVEYLSFMIGNESIVADMNNIDKFMIIPGRENTEIYLKSENNIYTYEFSISETPGLYKLENFSNFTEYLSNDPFYSKNSLVDIHRFVRKEVLTKNIEPDIPVNLNTGTKEIPWLSIRISDEIAAYIGVTAKEKEKIDEMAQNVKEKLLYRTIDRFETHYDSFGDLFFLNQFNMYKIKSNGWVIYQYTPGIEGDEKGYIGAAFINAVETLDAIINLTNGEVPDIYVSGITETEDYYVFSFDYMYDSKVIALFEENHAAMITATATRTIEAKVIPLNADKMVGKIPDSKFITAYINVTKENNLIMNQMEAYNIYLGYKKSDEIQDIVSPVWIIEKKSGEKEIYKLPKVVD